MGIHSQLIDGTDWLNTMSYRNISIILPFNWSIINRTQFPNSMYCLSSNDISNIRKFHSNWNNFFSTYPLPTISIYGKELKQLKQLEINTKKFDHLSKYNNLCEFFQSLSLERILVCWVYFRWIIKNWTVFICYRKWKREIKITTAHWVEQNSQQQKKM